MESNAKANKYLPGRLRLVCIRFSHGLQVADDCAGSNQYRPRYFTGGCKETVLDSPGAAPVLDLDKSVPGPGHKV